MSTDTIRPRERDAVLSAIRAGVVPRAGQRHIQVGRVREVEALLRDLERVADGGSTIRFVIGDYGAGKTFFLHLIRSIALEKKLVAVHADLAPDRRLQATGGQARSLYAELLRNTSTRARPDGGALGSVVERFVTTALSQAREKDAAPETIFHELLAPLAELVGGYDFIQVVTAYWKGHDTGNEQLKSDALRWLRGEFATRNDARAALGVRTIVDDASVYDQLKLMARFVHQAGFSGIIVVLDEMVNLYKLANTQARNANYEQILRILNDCLQGTAERLGFLMAGTPEFLLDTRRGLYSYAALQSRLAENAFARDGLVDLSSPVLRLVNLTPEDFYILLGKIRHVFASGDPARYLVPDEALTAFMTHCSQRLGDTCFRTPRTMTKAFADLVAVLEQNPEASWKSLLTGLQVETDRDPLAGEVEDDGSDADDPPVAALAGPSPGASTAATPEAGDQGSGGPSGGAVAAATQKNAPATEPEAEDDLASFRL